MDWVFAIFTVATIAYVFSIIKDYLGQARLQAIKIDHLKLEKERLEHDIQTFHQGKEGIASQIEETRQAVKELEAVADRLKSQIKQREAQMAKRGKYRLGPE